MLKFDILINGGTQTYQKLLLMQNSPVYFGPPCSTDIFDHSLKTRLFVQLLYTDMCSHLVTAGASSTVVIADFVRLTNVCDSTTIISLIIIIIIY